MFKKKHKVKPASALRNPDSRKLRAEVIQVFNLEQSTVEPTLSGEAPLSVGTELVPDGLLISTFTTTTGDVNGLIYSDPETRDPLWVVIGKNTNRLLIPTVYTLRKRRFLVSLSMRGPAIERIKDGAELMMPGVILSIMPNDSSSIPPLPVNSLVAINMHGSSVPFAVGQLLLPLVELAKVLGSGGDTRGKAVRVLHYFGDHLWDSGSKREPPVDAPGILWASSEATGADAPVAVTEDAPVAARVTAPVVARVTAPVAARATAPRVTAPVAARATAPRVTAPVAARATAPRVTAPVAARATAPFAARVTAAFGAPADADPACIPEGELALDEPPNHGAADLSSDDLDQNLRPTLLQTIAHTSPQHTERLPPLASTLFYRPRFNSAEISDVDQNLRLVLLQTIARTLRQQAEPLPCPASAFLTLYLQPSRPVGSPTLDLKKSSFKNLTKFLKSAEKDGLVKLKDIQGVLTVMSVKPDHPEVLAHKPILTVGQVEARESEHKKAQETQPGVLDVQELWQPAGRVQALFNDGFRVNSDGLYTATEISRLVNTYLGNKRLKHPSKKGFVVTDDLLKNVLGKNGGKIVESIRRDELIQRIRGAMQAWHSIGEGSPVIKGTLNPVKVVVETRHGNKAVTLITGFEEYGVLANFLTNELKRICASSATSSFIEGQAEGGQAEEVLVQGNHLAAVRDLLKAQGIPNRLIQEEDKTGKKKKKRK